MAQLPDLERRVQSIYDDVLKGLADAYAYPLPVAAGRATSRPTVLLLGNHSSGKSSFINYLLDQPVQKTGLAPVDDGFTVIAYGDTDEFDGQTVVSHPELPFAAMERFGPGFLSHLRLKTRPIERLQSLTLIDSPGMIDSADTASGRTYDFLGVARHFAAQSDLILFLFDPSKPGTSGETFSVFLEALDDIEHKLLLLMHKVDQFHNIRDFARAYGALCWNLSKAIRTKDIPQIFCTYLPQLVDGGGEDQVGARVPLDDFDLARDEVVAEVQRTAARRADNLVTTLREQCYRVAMHSRVCAALVDRIRAVRVRFLVMGMVVAILAVFGAYLTRQQMPWFATAGISIGGLVLAVFVARLAAPMTRREEDRFTRRLDEIFERLYAKELKLDERADLRARWQSVKPRVIATLDAVGATNLPRVWGLRRRLARVERTLAYDVPRLRRTIELERPRSADPGA